jgi:ABC-type antimicrobial peptide transport system permease subunit
VHAPALRTSQRAVEPTLYLPMTQHFVPRMTLIVSAREASDATLGALRGALGVPEPDRRGVVMTLDDYLARTALATERIATVLIGAAALLALALAALGIYGAMSDAVGRRRREFALRLALGAQQWRVIAHVIGDAMRLTAGGAVAGALGSVAAMYWLARITPAAGAPTLMTLVIAPAAVAVLVLAACVLPARRALTADPLTIMRDH